MDPFSHASKGHSGHRPSLLNRTGVGNWKGKHANFNELESGVYANRYFYFRSYL